MEGNLCPPCLRIRHITGTPSATLLIGGKRKRLHVQSCLYDFYGLFDVVVAEVVEVAEVAVGVCMVIILGNIEPVCARTHYLQIHCGIM
jgi:hypothetical protein